MLIRRFIYFIQNICIFKYCWWGILMIFVYIVSAHHLVNIIMLFMISHWPQSLWAKLIILRADITRFYMYVYKLYVLSCSTLYEWILRSQLFFWKGRLFSDYFDIYREQQMRTKDELEQPLGLSSHGELLGVWCSNLSFW